MPTPNSLISEVGISYSLNPAEGFTLYKYKVRHVPSGQIFDRQIYVLGTIKDLYCLLGHWNTNLWHYWTEEVE